MTRPLSGTAPRRSLGKEKIRALLLEGIHPGAEQSLREDGYTGIDSHPEALDEGRLVEAIRDVYLLGIRSRTRVTERVLDAAPRLFAIGCFCIGTNQVDLAAAASRGIPVFHAPFANTRSVAELVLAEVVLLLRRVPERNALAHRGVWCKSARGAHEVRGKRLGIVGYGHIGTQVGLLAEAMGMQVVFFDILPKLQLGNARPVATLGTLLEQADVVTLHVPDTPATRGMIGAPEIARMHAGAMLCNASRGTVVDLDALATALEQRHLAGAAIDVFPEEPASNEESFASPLARFDNVILTPHVGGSTEEAQEAIGRDVAGKLVHYSNNGSTISAVNFPEVSLPEHEGRHRILHVHHNRPGMLSRINEVFSRGSINVAGQYLRTTPSIGYVVIDVEAGDGDPDSRELRRELAAIDGTIRTRVLF